MHFAQCQELYVYNSVSMVGNRVPLLQMRKLEPAQLNGSPKAIELVHGRAGIKPRVPRCGPRLIPWECFTQMSVPAKEAHPKHSYRCLLDWLFGEKEVCFHFFTFYFSSCLLSLLFSIRFNYNTPQTPKYQWLK